MSQPVGDVTEREPTNCRSKPGSPNPLCCSGDPHSKDCAAISSPALRAPRTPRRPIQFVEKALRSENDQRTTRTNVVEINTVAHLSPRKTEPILPTRHRPAARSNTSTVTSPVRSPKDSPDLRLVHSVFKSGPTVVKSLADKQDNSKGQKSTTDRTCNKPSFELQYAHLSIDASFDCIRHANHTVPQKRLNDHPGLRKESRHAWTSRKMRGVHAFGHHRGDCCPKKLRRLSL